MVLPGALGHARELTAVCHLAKADTAEAELAVDRVRTTALLAPGVGTDLELRGRVGFVDQGGLGPVSYTHLDVYKRQGRG